MRLLKLISTSTGISIRIMIHWVVCLLLLALPPGKTCALSPSWHQTKCTTFIQAWNIRQFHYKAADQYDLFQRAATSSFLHLKPKFCYLNRAVATPKTSHCRKASMYMLDGDSSCVRMVSESNGNPPSLEQGLLELLDGGVFDSSFALPKTATLSEKSFSFAYKWQKPKLYSVESISAVSGRINSTLEKPDATKSDDTSSIGRLKKNSEGDEPSPSISKLSAELESLRAEHRDINEISDQLAAKGQYAGGVQYQLMSLKKRKLFLKDRIAFLEAKLEALLRESILENENEQKPSDPVGAVLGEMMRRLRDLGLKPEQVPPHKDSFFLSLMKALQRVGLRPTGYDFRESTVMGSERQFPNAAKKARFEVLKLLSSQADKLNPIGGWKLSPEEFQRYFSKAWWTLPAARDDLFMAAAHLYTVRIVMFSIDPDRLDEQVYDPPTARPRATIYLCRRDAHVISTAPLKSGIPNATVELTSREISNNDFRLRVPMLDTPLAPVKEENKKVSPRRVSDVAKEDLDAGLGLLDHVLDTDDNYQADADISASLEAFEDDEVVEDRASIGRRAGSMYEAPVRTRRIFVAVTLEPDARAAISDVVAALRRDFPLDSRLLDGVVRWVDPDSYHVTLDALDVDSAKVSQVVSAVGSAVSTSRQSPFVVRTGELGSFWRSAGSGWGRVPRVVWLGLDSSAAGPLLRLREAVDAACSGIGEGSTQGFCAHITLGKTQSRGREGLAVAERRTLRALGKWVQDPDRPVSLQQLLAGVGPASATDGGQGLGRGNKRARSWLRQVDVGTLSGRQKQAVTKQLRKSGRDLGGLNAQLASDFAAPGDFDAGAATEQLVLDSPGMPATKAGVEIAVEAVSVIEAVPVPGSGRVRYTVLERFELNGGGSAS